MGVYQGCVIACLFFILVYQIVIDFVEAHGSMPYTFKSSVVPAVSLLQLAFVDDHTLINCAPCGSQHNLNLMTNILEWTRCFA